MAIKQVLFVLLVLSRFHLYDRLAITSTIFCCYIYWFQTPCGLWSPHEVLSKLLRMNYSHPMRLFTEYVRSTHTRTNIGPEKTWFTQKRLYPIHSKFNKKLFLGTCATATSCCCCRCCCCVEEIGSACLALTSAHFVSSVFLRAFFLVSFFHFVFRLLSLRRVHFKLKIVTSLAARVVVVAVGW